MLGVSCFTLCSFHYRFDVLKVSEYIPFKGGNYSFIVSLTLTVYHGPFPLYGLGVIFVKDFFIETHSVKGSEH